MATMGVKTAFGTALLPVLSAIAGPLTDRHGKFAELMAKSPRSGS